VFGFSVFVYVTKEKRNEFNVESQKCILMVAARRKRR
jgi:hypothetical protein